MGISREQALDCFRSDDLVGMGMEADEVRRKLHPEGVVRYAVEAVVDAGALKDGATEHVVAEVCSKVEKLTNLGVTSVCLAGLRNLETLQTALREIRRRNPDLWISALAAAELQAMTTQTAFPLRDLLARLMEAGLNTIADDGFTAANHGAASDLDARIEIHRAAHRLVMPTVATIIFGDGESPEQRVGMFDSIRNLQQETGGFAAFTPIAAAAPNGRDLDGVTSVERLKTLAIARMFLDGIDTIQTSAAPEGLKVLQMGLRFGANDVGPITPHGSHEEHIRQIIRDAGFRPAQRQMGYSAMLVG